MSSLNSLRVRDLIRAVRQCKTPSEEQALVNRERAIIRESMKDTSAYNRTRNMLKLMYLSMIGYSTSFSQLEVVNLLAQKDFSGKRTGYVSLPIMVEEKDEVLTLVENHMKADMNSENVLLRAVALNAAANIASEDMARDIIEDVMRLIKNFNPYLRKKACLCGLRLVRKVPEFSEYFLEELYSMFHDRYASSLMCALALANYCLQTPLGNAYIERYRTLIPDAVRQLRALANICRAGEYTIDSAVTDPFLQIKLLEFMRILGRNDAKVSDIVHEALVVLPNALIVEKNVTHAVRYECARTIQAIQSDPHLRALGISMMSRLLEMKSNNYRYVALEALTDYAAANPLALQSHQNAVMQAIREEDPSIQIKALELIVQMMCDENVRLLVPDLIDQLHTSSDEMRERLAAHLGDIVESKSPTEEWRIDTSIKMLKVGRKHITVPFTSRLLSLITRQSEDIQTKAVSTLWDEVASGVDAEGQQREAFLVCILWCLGEYVELLLKKRSHLTAEKVSQTVVDATLSSNFKKVKLYGMTAMMKIASRHPDAKNCVLKALRIFASSMDSEQQQRALEGITLLSQFPQEAANCFGPMPPMSAMGEVTHVPVSVMSTASPIEKASAEKLLDDLFGSANDESLESNVAVDSPYTGSSDNTHTDPVAGLFARPPGEDEALLSPFVTYKELDDFSVDLAASMANNVISVKVRIRSKTDQPMENIEFQAAVPRTSSIALGTLSTTCIPPLEDLVQCADITVGPECRNPRQLMLRVKLVYSVQDSRREQLVEISHTV